MTQFSPFGAGNDAQFDSGKNHSDACNRHAGKQANPAKPSFANFHDDC
jgi:hypothetical protein